MNDAIANEILEQVKTLGKAISNLTVKVDNLETKVDNLETKVDKLETKVDGLETKVNSLEEATKENTIAIEKLEKITKENTKAIEKLEKVTAENTLEIIKLKGRVDDLEEQRKSDRLDLMDVLQRMDESISKRFDDIDNHFEKIYSLQAYNDVEHAEFRQAIKVLKMRDSVFAKRLEELEEWKKDLGSELFAV